MTHPSPPSSARPPPSRGAESYIDRGRVREWDQTVREKIRYADEDLRKSNVARVDASATRNRARKQTDANQFATNERLRVRAKETAAVRTKLEDELEQVNVELALSIELQDKVSDYLEKQKVPIQSCLQCMEVRERRPQQENVADDVTKQLQLQQRDLEGSFNLAQRVLSEVEQQLHQLTQMKNQLHQGIAEKGDSLSIDIECLALSSAHSDPKRLDDASLRTEGNWTRAFLQLIKQAAVARYNSQQVRARGATASSHRRDVDMSARKRVIAALEGKLTQTRIHRNRIEDRLIEASKEITEAQRAREEVYNALGEKQMPYQIARGRIRVRDRKPTSEKVCDAPDRSLEQELGGLSRTIGSLKDRNGQLADKLELLERMRSELENDCNDKNKAIHLDTFCLRLQHQNAPDNRNPSVSTPKKYKSTASRANRSRGGSRPGSCLHCTDALRSAALSQAL